MSNAATVIDNVHVVLFGLSAEEHDWLQAEISALWSAEDDEDLFPCADNFRLALVGDAASEEEYERREMDGCCGQYDAQLGPSPSGRFYRYGFNFGH